MAQVKLIKLKVNVPRTNKIFSRYTSQKSITPVRCRKALWMRSEIGPCCFASLGFILALPYLVTVFERFFSSIAQGRTNGVEGEAGGTKTPPNTPTETPSESRASPETVTHQDQPQETEGGGY